MHTFKGPKPLGNRSSIDIISHILEVANGGASKTKTMQRAVLGHKQMTEYVYFLLKRGLLAYEHYIQRGEAQRYRTTEKALRFVSTHNQLSYIIKEEEAREQQLLSSVKFQMLLSKKTRSKSSLIHLSFIKKSKLYQSCDDYLGSWLIRKPFYNWSRNDIIHDLGRSSDNCLISNQQEQC